MADEKVKSELKPEEVSQTPGEYKVTNPMEKKPVIAPDGHVNLSQEDIDARV